MSASEQSNSYQLTLWQFLQIVQYHQMLLSGAIDIVKIKTGWFRWCRRTHTNIPIRGDGTGGVVSVTVTSGAVTAVNVTSAGSGYTFGNNFKCTNSFSRRN